MQELFVSAVEWVAALTLFLGVIVAIRYLEHRERIRLIETGLLAPSQTDRPQYPRGSALLRGGLITAMVGLAVTLGLYTLGFLLPAPFNTVPGRFGPWLLPGLIPLAVGIALIASYYLAPPRSERASRPHDQATEVADHTSTVNPE